MTPLYTFESILATVNQNIKNISYKHHAPQSLFEPITYILSLGGKRVRPALALMACDMYGEKIEKAIPVALGIEVFHNFTLLHDDLMDKADVRRGQPTVHIKWYDNLAILSGDAMLIEAYKEIAKINNKYLAQALDLFSIMATEICCGQQFDMEFEQRMSVTQEEYLNMIRLKTAVLLGCSLKLGAMVAGAKEGDMNHLYDFGINLGLAFQLKDDLLDVYGNPETFGKRIGGDILCNKKTLLLINALSDTSVKEELTSWINKTEYSEDDKIAAVTEIYNKLNLKQRSEELITDYYQKAIRSLEQVGVDEDRKKVLYNLAEDLMFRES